MAGNDSRQDWLKSAGPFLTLGMQLAVVVVVFFFAGRWLDGKFGTAPWLTVVALLAGVTGGSISFYKTVTAIGKREDQELRERRAKEQHREP